MSVSVPSSIEASCCLSSPGSPRFERGVQPHQSINRKAETIVGISMETLPRPLRHGFTDKSVFLSDKNRSMPLKANLFLPSMLKNQKCTAGRVIIASSVRSNIWRVSHRLTSAKF
jgi:hypothetical protein